MKDRIILFLLVINSWVAIYFSFFSRTSDHAIQSGAEFFLDGSVYQCSVVHKLLDAKPKSGEAP